MDKVIPFDMSISRVGTQKGGSRDGARLGLCGSRNGAGLGLGGFQKRKEDRGLEKGFARYGCGEKSFEGDKYLTGKKGLPEKEGSVGKRGLTREEGGVGKKGLPKEEGDVGKGGLTEENGIGGKRELIREKGIGGKRWLSEERGLAEKDGMCGRSAAALGAEKGPGERGGVIDIGAIRRNGRKLRAGLIAPAEEEVKTELAKEHAAEPIKDMGDIDRISQFLIQRKRYRDNMLFIVGINFGLRVSDLRTLRFCQLINDDFTFRDRFPILERKTRNTRKRQQNRYITINMAVIEAVTLYLEHTPDICLSDYMFRSESNRGRNRNEPLSKQAVDLILKGIANDLGLGNRMATHSLRKTFAYHQMVMSGNDPRKLLLLQKMFGHSSAAQTLDYIGITSEEIDEAYRRLNLGSVHNYLMDSSIEETEAGIG